MFEPLVFETDNGRKFVFENTEARDLGDGILFCTIDSLKEIRREPVVQFHETGDVDEFGNPILEAVSVEIHLRRSYGSNNALIDTKSGKVYLFSQPGTNDGFLIYEENDRNKYVFSTDSYIFLLARERSDGVNELTLYSIDKSELGSGSLNLEPRTVSSVFSVSWIDDISDDYAIV